jgi:hypothetical protein
MWEDTFNINKIEVHLPNSMNLIEFYNVDNYEFSENMYVINKLKTKNYFGLVVNSKELIKEMHLKQNIIIKFYNDSDILAEKNLTANLYRPFVKILNKPDKLIIDETNKLSTNIEVEVSGFGKIELLNDIESGGEFFERSESIYREILRRVLTNYNKEINKDKEKKIIINPKYIERKTKEIMDTIIKKNIPIEVDQTTLNELYKWLENEENIKKINEIVSKEIENLIVDSILFYFEKNPENDVYLPQGQPSIYIEKAIKQVRLRFRYKDSVGNEYEPISFKIDIIDNRKNNFDSLEIPIKIKWNFKKINPIEGCEMNVS